MMTSGFKEQQKREKFLDNSPILRWPRRCRADGAESITKYERFRIAEALVQDPWNTNDIIIQEDDEGDKFYIIEKGSVVCTKRMLQA